jgi:Ca2+-binding EF-hand superfamily protein
MPLPALLLPVFALAAAQAPTPTERPIVVTGHTGPPFISPMGEPFRARSPGEDTLADWFRQADRNHDGMLTADEMEADADRFFATLDTDGDGDIEPEELVRYEWDLAPEIQVTSKLRRARTAANPDTQTKSSERRRERWRPDSGSGDGYDPEGLQGGARYALLNIPEPVAAADTNLDRAISLSEFRQAAIGRFQLLDRNHQGELTLQELQALLPAAPAPGHRAKHREDSADTRYGVPLPPGN